MVGNIEQMLDEFKNGTYDFTNNGKCVQCGKCCTNILPMTENEISRIKKYIKNNGAVEHKHILPLSTVTIDMTCPFLNDSKPNGKCDIYEVRPRICRDFICCPDKREYVNREYAKKTKIVSVRDTFFGSNE